MRARFPENRSKPNWTAIGAGIGAALGAGTHAMGEWLAVCVAAGALADALAAPRMHACALARRGADRDGRSPR